jgi:hypothetical protein
MRFKKGSCTEMSLLNSYRLRVAGLIFLLMAMGVLQFAGASSSSADTVPYKDPSAVGSITLCDTSGHELTSGRADFTPFAWRAVGSTPAKAPYDAAGRTASLYAFQPMQNVDPSGWFGENLTGSAKYTDAANPMVAATPADSSLAGYLTAYPTKWDGLVQLRMFVGAPRFPTYFATYNAATIRVSGNTWTLVQGGGGSCTAGSAVSNELIVPSIASMPTPSAYPSVAAPSAQSQSASNGSGSSSKSTRSTGKNGHSTSAARSDANASAASKSTVDGTAVSDVSASSGSSGTPLGLIVAIALAVLIGGGGGTWYWLRRRSVTDGSP